MPYYCPDASVSCDPADWTRGRELRSPSIVVEVLSPSTERVDRTEKLAAYQALPTIQDILLVDSRRRYVEHYHRILPHALQEWRHFVYDQEEQLVRLPCIEVSFSLRQLYRKVYLEDEDA